MSENESLVGRLVMLNPHIEGAVPSLGIVIYSDASICDIYWLFGATRGYGYLRSSVKHWIWLLNAHLMEES